MDSSYSMGRVNREILDALIGRVFNIEDITAGNPQKDFIVRYRGQLRTEDTEATYDQLCEQLAPYEITPLFRWDEDRHAILLIPRRPKPGPSNPWINLIMFILTFFSVTFIGGLNAAQVPLDNINNLAIRAAEILWAGIPYAVSLLAILGAHEFGHYLMCRHYKVNATLPYFVPFPSLFGTMGAVIMMKEQPRNRRQLLDIGVAGPLAGLAVAIPVLIFGLYLSKLDAIPAVIPSGVGLQLEGNSLLYLFLKFIMFGKLLPAPATFGALPGWLYWIGYFFTGKPYPLGGLDVMIHPIAWAGWAGFLVTSLNLIPAGQLDGGHVLYVLIGRKRMAKILPFIIAAIALLSIVSISWLLWAAILFFLGRRLDDPDDQITPLDPGRRRLAIFAMIIFVLVFTPVPLSFIGNL
jgi:membrane-associated protease RseP (regulator of RpoE activity)